MAKDHPPSSTSRPPAELAAPNVRLHGVVDEAMLDRWLDQTAALGTAALVLELTTTGGDADVARRIADDVRLFRTRDGRRTLFLGKTVVHSAGVTILGGFERSDRWLTRDAAMLVHGRKLAKTLNLDGPLRSERPKVEAVLAEIDDGLRAERAEFLKFVEGSDVTLEELESRIAGDWRLTAEEALRRGLIAGVV